MQDAKTHVMYQMLVVQMLNVQSMLIMRSVNAHQIHAEIQALNAD